MEKAYRAGDDHRPSDHDKPLVRTTKRQVRPDYNQATRGRRQKLNRIPVCTRRAVDAPIGCPNSGDASTPL
jgi:hypothetical protein